MELPWFITLGGRTSIHCAGGWILLGIVTLLRLGVIVGYWKIARDWYLRERQATSTVGVQALRELRDVFTYCSLCGYVLPIVLAFTPVWSVTILALVYLNWRTWRYIGHLPDLDIIYSNKAAEILEQIVNGHYENYATDAEKLAAIRREIQEFLGKKRR